MCIYVCRCVLMYACRWVLCPYTCAHVYVCVHVIIFVLACVRCVHACFCVHVWECVCVCTSIRVRVCVCVRCVCLYALDKAGKEVSLPAESDSLWESRVRKSH